ncbi:hypothetical protein C6A77_05190 [Pseudomonas sp. AFG_SD02_1510_Pfu_092]|uniref:BrnT family toxin n=1 Tax=Pseudomonas sp. AFG_SD02_1510_Pfu_092 TaxID=2259497 RepID=UPI000DEF5DC3|nr:BrnT family toxin [Pseudomonas sp. AFG_SD02_1510_Pfu_092]RCL28768.1 hypothetical protein C6A77_05190 [Pseudomonas sp. AFG_SD02_1510_Pfu_092]
MWTVGSSEAATGGWFSPGSSPFPSQSSHADSERWVSLGWLKALIGVVVYTERRGEVIRIICARKATRWEARHYDQIIKN